MKKLFQSLFLIIPISVCSQNEQILNDMDMRGNLNPHVYANNVNMPETPDPQTVYNLNKNNALQVADQLQLPQGAVNINTDRNMNADNIQQVTVQQKQSTGIISVRSNSLNTGSSGVSVSITKHRSHKIRHHLDHKVFDKLFDKKFRKVHHYKKKGRIKRCASFS